MPTIVCAGLITVDFVFDLPNYPVEGTKTRATGARKIAGGGALNAAAAIAALGGNAILAGAIGDDDLGVFLRQDLRRHGVDDRMVKTVPETGTAHSAILMTAGGERTIINHRPAALFDYTPGIPTDLAFDALLADTRWPLGAHALAVNARAAGKPVVIDAEAPVSLASRALDLATHLAFSAQGLADYAGEVSSDALGSVARRHTAWTCVTRGDEPVLCHNGTTPMEIPTFRVRALDTLGGGDVWHGSFALGLAKGLPEPEAARLANAAAAVKVSRVGEGAKFPTMAEVNDLLSGS